MAVYPAFNRRFGTCRFESCQTYDNLGTTGTHIDR
jgi:hypothetical protein